MLLAAMTGYAIAGAQPIPPTSPAPTTQVALGETPVDVTANGNRQGTPYKPENRVRCWQEGKMIFEASGINVERAASISSLETLKAGAGTIQLFDFKNGLCIMEKAR